MSKRVPLSRCKLCVHYRGRTCPLEDLDPCRYKPTSQAKARRAETILTAVVTFFGIVAALAAVLLCGCTQKQPTQPVQEGIHRPSTIELLRMHNTADTLAEWDALTLAIALTESRFDPSAEGSAEDRGLLQLRPIYVAEVNRIAGTDYTPEDAFDPAKAVAMYNTLQAHYNPDRDTDTAIRYHNSGAAYRREVLKNLEFIRAYEKARQIITNFK